MLAQLENAVMFVAVIWGAVRLAEHFLPSAYTRLDEARMASRSELEKRIDALEAKLEGK